jgi:ABC-type sugar transport system ATPase subunit
MAKVTLSRVSKKFGAIDVLHALDLEMADGRLTVVLGPSGCGKSTLLRLVAGLEQPTSGEIDIGERRVTHVAPAERRVAMVFQSYALYPHMTTYENMAFGLKLAKRDRQSIDERVRRAARMLHIEELLLRKPREMSGGQRQRVALGRALVREPDVFLFDEPLSNLDAALRSEMRLEIARMQEELRATVLHVTHDQVEAMTLAHTVVVLRAGRLEQVGPPMEVYREPRTAFVATFFGSPGMNLVRGRLVRAGGDTAEIEIAGQTVTVPRRAAGLAPGSAVDLGVRPAALAPTGDGELRLRGEVLLVEPLGAETLTHVQLAGGERLVARLLGDARPTRGETLELSAPRAECHLFDADGRALERSFAPAL